MTGDRPQTADHRVHPSSVFGRQAEAYTRARPRYPSAAVDHLCDALDVAPADVVVDVAAGTGLLSVPLRDRGLRVIAVEPDAGMRRVLALQLDDGQIVDGVAEQLPLPDRSAAAVTVGQAFHWFDAAAALQEFARVLHAGADVGLVWNRRDQSDPMQRRLSTLLEPYRDTAPAHRGGAWRTVFVDGSADALGFGPLRSWSLPWTQRLDSDLLADRAASTSFIAALDAPTRAGVLRRVRALVGSDDKVSLRHVTEVHVTRLAG